LPFFHGSFSPADKVIFKLVAFLHFKKKSKRLFYISRLFSCQRESHKNGSVILRQRPGWESKHDQDVALDLSFPIDPLQPGMHQGRFACRIDETIKNP
jgi:hypothetical protein